MVEQEFSPATNIAHMAYRNFETKAHQKRMSTLSGGSDGSHNGSGGGFENVIATMLFKKDDEGEYFRKIYLTIEQYGFLDFDVNELVHLTEKRHMYLESISKLYNELTLMNKAK